METPIREPQIRMRRLGVVRLIAFGSVIGVIALFAVGMVNRSARPVENGIAPQFEIPTFSGSTFSLAEHRGHVVVVNFWASWCGPCRDEAPILERVWREYKDKGVVFVGVDYVDTESAALAFIREFDITYPNGPDIGTDVSHRYRIQGVPETYFVGKDGNLHGNYIGPTTYGDLTARIQDLLMK